MKRACMLPGGGFPEWGIPGMIPVAKTSLAYTAWQ